MPQVTVEQQFLNHVYWLAFIPQHDTLPNHVQFGLRPKTCASTRSAVDATITMNGIKEPLTLRPWARDNSDATALQEVLARVNAERGHFRNITEASLQEEIATEGALELSESEEEEDDGVEEQDSKQIKVTTQQDLLKVKFEMLAFVREAEQDALKSLDFVSLLESAHNSAGGVTVSEVLKQSVPLGSLGTDMWHRMPEDKPRRAQEELIATSVRLRGLQSSADALVSAAARLKDNAEKETKYWEEILAISDKGWSVSRIRRDSHMLGVHFGFSGSVPQFSRRDLAALVTDGAGNITLERGIGSKPTAMRAVVRRNGRVVGASKLPRIPNLSSTTLDTRIRNARDSIFDEELYHELIRESRELTAAGVSLQGSHLRFNTSIESAESQDDVSLELVSLDQDHALGHDATNEQDHLAEATLLAARLLLGQAHKERLKLKASLPKPLSEKKEEPQNFPILKPLVWLWRHQANIAYLNGILDKVAGLLRKSSIPFNLQRLTLDITGLMDITTVEMFVKAFLQPMQTTGTLEIRPAGSETPLAVQVIAEMSLNSSVVTSFSLVAPDGSRYRDYPDLPDLVESLDDLLSGLLARLLADVLGSQWKCDLRELRVQRLVQTASSNVVARIQVRLDSTAQALVLESENNRVEWKNEGSSEARSFTEAARALATFAE